MVSRENEVLIACAILGVVLTAFVADGLDAPPVVATSVLVFVAAVLPMGINNRRQSGGGA